MGTSVTGRYAALTRYHCLFGRLLGLLIATILTISCAHSRRTPPSTALVLVALPPSVTFEKPEAADENFCTDPAKYPKRRFDSPQLSAAELMALFRTPSDERELLSNIKLVVDRDLLVQTAFFDDAVLLKYFGASQISWDRSQRAAIYGTYVAGPLRIATVGGALGGSFKGTIEVESHSSCYSWREVRTPASPSAWLQPATYYWGSIRIDVGTAADIDVRTVKEIFGADPDERTYWVNQEFGMTLTIPGTLAFENRGKERSPAPFFRHRIEFTPQQTGQELPERGSRRVFADNTKIVAITVVQEERTL